MNTTVAGMRQTQTGPLQSANNGGYLQLSGEKFQESFNKEPFGFTHSLSALDLFSNESLQGLSEAYAGSRRDYFIASSAPTPGTSFYAVPSMKQTPREALENLDKQNCRILLKRVENHHDGFRELLNTLFGQLQEMRPDLERSRVRRLESSILISSGSTTTPVHFDPESGFFSQIEGEKFYHVYPPDCPSEEELERFYIRGRVDIGQLDINRLDPARELVFSLGPGKGLHQPQNSPHWVQTGKSRSVSYTFVFETDDARSSARTRMFNHLMRTMGQRPSQVGRAPQLDRMKSTAMTPAIPVQLAVRFGSRVLSKAQRLLSR